MPARFPFVTAGLAQGPALLWPMLPFALRRPGGEGVRVQGLVDSGASVNVLPFDLGLRLGASWDSQKTQVKLTGNLAGYEARALLLEGQVGDFPPVRLVFAWSRAERVPLLLGQVNFFQEFDLCFHAAHHFFEIEPAQK